MQHRDMIIIQKIISEITIGEQMLGDISYDDFLTDEKLKRAIAMTVINIGELTKNISQETREQFSHIPWKAISGMRDLAAHKYQTLRMEDVYQTAKYDFPDLKTSLSELLK